MHHWFAMPESLAATQKRAWRVSLFLTLLRLALSPVVLFMAWQWTTSWPLVLVLTVALVSDIMDGRVVAWAGVDASGLRALDSAVDTVFYLSAAVAAWHRQPAPFHQYAWAIAAVIALEGANNGYGLLKYGRTPGYHAKSAKLFGLCLFASLALLLGGMSFNLLPVTLVLGTIAQVESLCITTLLTRWTHDVPSVWHAWQLRRESARG